MLAAAWLGCTTPSGDDDDTGLAPGEVGFCWKQCVTPDDCCDLFTGAGYMQCRNGNTPTFGFLCNAGVCEFDGCSSDDECQTVLQNPAMVCHDLDGKGLCIEPCSVATDCGTADDVCEPLVDGTLACMPPPCQSDADCPNDTFDCVDGECIFTDCRDDADCTHGGTCQQGSCRCTASDECSESLDCVPVPT